MEETSLELNSAELYVKKLESLPCIDCVRSWLKGEIDQAVKNITHCYELGLIKK